MNCTVCSKPIFLVPSAEERARKYGEPADHYRRLFTSHVACALAQRKQQTSELMARLRVPPPATDMAINHPAPEGAQQPKYQ